MAVAKEKLVEMIFRKFAKVSGAIAMLVWVGSTPAMAVPIGGTFCQEHAIGFCQSQVDAGVLPLSGYSACHEEALADCIRQTTRHGGGGDDGWGGVGGTPCIDCFIPW